MSPSDVIAGMEIEHRVFGRGTILRVRNGHFGPEANIKFIRCGIRDMLIQFCARNMEPAKEAGK